MNRMRGFTLIELLVVIAVIGVLSAVVLSSLNTARTKAQYTGIVQDLQQIEKALHLVHNDLGCWPRESATVCIMPGFSGETQVTSLVSNTSGLGKYLKKAPTFPFPHAGTNYILDNDGDSHEADTCATVAAEAYQGMVIQVRNGGYNLSTIFYELERIIDRSADPTTAAAMYCGKIRYVSSDIFYSISDTQ